MAVKVSVEKSLRVSTSVEAPTTKAAELLDGHTHAWWNGYYSRMGRNMNPYHRDTEEFEDWIDGWEAKYFNEVP